MSRSALRSSIKSVRQSKSQLPIPRRLITSPSSPSPTTSPIRPTLSPWGRRSTAWPTIGRTCRLVSRRTENERNAGADWFTVHVRRRRFPNSPSSRSISSIATCRPTCESIAKKLVSSSSTPAESTRRAFSASGPRDMGANKFTTRVLTQGNVLLVWVDACQPDYQLRTKLFDVPPYLKPDQAEEADARGDRRCRPPSDPHRDGFPAPGRR